MKNKVIKLKESDLINMINDLVIEGVAKLTESEINPKYTHFAVFKDTGKIADGWEYNGVDIEDIKNFSKIDLKDNYPDNKLSDFKIVTTRGLTTKGIDPFNSDNWYRISF